MADGFNGRRMRLKGLARWTIAVCLVMAASRVGAGAVAPDKTLSYERADAETIRTHARDIVADPRFARRISFADWLRQKLGRWERPETRLPDWLGQGLVWTIIVWCVLTLVAILAHLVWTIWLLVRPASQLGSGAGSASADSYDSATFEQLWQRSAELARQRAFRDAVGVLALALLRRLESMQILRYHKSKTNGEYVREYPGERPGRREFGEFVATFERTVYGGLPVQEQTHQTMSTLAERIIKDASQDT